jgi:hypothetical protein
LTKLVPLRPVLCRRNLIPKKTAALLQDFLLRGKEHDITCVTVDLYSDGNDWHVLAGLDVTKRDLIRKPVNHSKLPNELQKIAEDLTYRLMANQYVAQDFGEVDGNFVISEGFGKYSLSFFPGCAILYAHNLDHFIKGNRLKILDAPDSIANRAQICTIILEKAEGQHQRIAQLPKVEQALRSWRKMTGVSVHSTQQTYGFEIVDPTSKKITTCSKGFISKGA